MNSWGVFREGIGLVSTAKGMSEQDAHEQCGKLTAFNGHNARYSVGQMTRGIGSR